MFARFLVVITFLTTGDMTHGQSSSIEVADPLIISRIYSDSAGQSHFSDELQSFSLIEFSPELPPVSAGESMSANNVVILSAPAYGVADWHAVPRRQINIILGGEVEIEVSDGEKRRFGPGSFILGEDTDGVGHITRVVSDGDAYFAVISLDEAEGGGE